MEEKEKISEKEDTKEKDLQEYAESIDTHENVDMATAAMGAVSDMDKQGSCVDLKHTTCNSEEKTDEIERKKKSC